MVSMITQFSLPLIKMENRREVELTKFLGHKSGLLGARISTILTSVLWSIKDVMSYKTEREEHPLAHRFHGLYGAGDCPMGNQRDNSEVVTLVIRSTLLAVSSSPFR